MPKRTRKGTARETIIARAYDYASSYDLRSAREILQAPRGARLVGAYPLMVQYDTHRIIVVFDYGSVVFFGYEEFECRALLESLGGCAQRKNKSIATDDLSLTLVPRRRRPEGTDVIYIQEFNRHTATLVAVVLSRSVALEYYEGLVESSLEGLEATVQALASTGRIPRRQRQLTRQVGLALLIEHELAFSVGVFDDPEIVWEGGKRNDQFYRALTREFDLNDRIKVIQQKVSLISRWSTFVISRLEGSRAEILEWLIVILILSEIILMLLKLA
jgi:uncharacterized Rmd1/YagE family protein